MNIYAIYKFIKARLSTVAPCFFYIGQYTKGRENTSYRAPAIYIEMPSNLNFVYYPGNIKAAKEAQFKIHIISGAPYKNHDNDIQDTAIDAHQTIINSVESLLSGWVIKDEYNRLLTQQIHPTGGNLHNYSGPYVFSILSFSTEFYSRSAL